MDFFSGLENLGLKGFENLDIYASDSQQQTVDTEEERLQRLKNELAAEAEHLYDKSYTCPVCDKAFKSKTMKSNRARLLSTDMDLRPVHQDIDSVKYDVVACPHCGYAVLARYFGPLSKMQVNKIKEAITSQYTKSDKRNKVYSYDTAIERSKLALLSSVIKGAKDSEKAYVCLKIAWLFRGKAEHLAAYEEAEKERQEFAEQEKQFLRKAYDGLYMARQKEHFPICGMDEVTFDYLLAALAYRFDDYETSAKLVGEILSNKAAGFRVKEKTRDLKEELKRRIMEIKTE